MFTLKLLRKIGKILRGGANSREIFLGFLLGVVWGFIPGFNLAQFLMLFLVLLLNANFGFMLMGLLVGSLACYGLSPLTFEVGYTLINSLQGLFTSLHNTSLIAWVGLDNYCLVGGVPVALVIGSAVVMLWVIWWSRPVNESLSSKLVRRCRSSITSFGSKPSYSLRLVASYLAQTSKKIRNTPSSAPWDWVSLLVLS